MCKTLPCARVLSLLLRGAQATARALETHVLLAARGGVRGVTARGGVGGASPRAPPHRAWGCSTERARGAGGLALWQRAGATWAFRRGRRRPRRVAPGTLRRAAGSRSCRGRRQALSYRGTVRRLDARRGGVVRAGPVRIDSSGSQALPNDVVANNFPGLCSAGRWSGGAARGIKTTGWISLQERAVERVKSDFRAQEPVSSKYLLDRATLSLLSRSRSSPPGSSLFPRAPPSLAPRRPAPASSGGGARSGVRRFASPPSFELPTPIATGDSNAN
jgi:hypothetical protein